MGEQSTRAGWARCSFVAQDAGDPLVGTAPPARRWLLVEHPGPWGRAGYADSGLDPALVSGLNQWARSTSGRVVLIRRPGRAGGPRGSLRWYVADSRPHREGLRTGSAVDAEAFAGIAARLAADPDAPLGTDTEEPLVLVCTHGRHDTCCAVRGRPIAAALARSHPEATWECSHIGGCRFAPAVVLLPHGFVLGGMQVPADASTAVARYRSGIIDPAHLRGRSSLAPVVQAAQHAARIEFGVDGVDDLSEVELEGDAGSMRWRVQLGPPNCVVRLTERRVEPGRPLTCSATAQGWFREFRVDHVARLSAGAGPDDDANTRRRALRRGQRE